MISGEDVGGLGESSSDLLTEIPYLDDSSARANAKPSYAATGGKD
jgi:hypothetical protein